MQTPEQEYKRGLDLFGKKDYKGAFDAWKDAADRGYPKAMCDVGWMYSQGNSSVPKDNAKAFEYMLKAAEAGYVRAQNNIGLYYKNGTGTAVDIEKAVYWLELAEKANYEKLAENTLKNCRQLLLSQRGPRVSPEQEHALGMAAFSAKDYTKSFEHWLRAAEAGSPEGMCDVGWMYSQGYGVQKDNDKAFEWMLRSSNLGYVRAQNNLGLYYKNGTGTPVNLELAVHWLEKAEKANYPKLAKKTLQEAKELLAKKAAEEKVAPSPDSNDTSSPQQAYALGLEMFGKKKFQQAFDYWLKAAEAGYTKAMCDVGWMYSQGHGVEKDNQKAFEYMLKAAQQGYVRAQNNIGLYYKNGTGCKPDLRQAVIWLERAEKANYDKLAKKSLKEAKRMLEEEAKGSKPIAAAPPPIVDEDEQRSSGPEGNMDKYKSALKVALASKSVSEEQCKVLADLRREHQITDRLHEQCLIELGYSLEEFRRMTVEAPKGPECVVCLDAVADHCILFCMHVCLCKDCALSFQDGQGKGKGTCPKCRTKVEMVKKIF